LAPSKTKHLPDGRYNTLSRQVICVPLGLCCSSKRVRDFDLDQCAEWRLVVGVVSLASVVEDILISIKDADCDAVLGL
jgi:hypothetical protein